MWHLKTNFGLFWVVPISEAESKYYLGVNDEPLGIYTDAEKAALDVHNQKTGYLKWDSQSRIKVPQHINEWDEGEPRDWAKPK
jgi:hypothetical protein